MIFAIDTIKFGKMSLLLNLTLPAELFFGQNIIWVIGNSGRAIFLGLNDVGHCVFGDFFGGKLFSGIEFSGEFLRANVGKPP